MNLRVNLILAGEQRSGSPIGLKFLARLLGALLMGAILFAAGKNGVSIADLTRKVRRVESEWESLEPRKAEAVKLIQQATENMAILQEIKGWRKSRTVWYSQLDSLADCVPETIQLTSLTIQHDFTLVGGQVVGRSFTMTMGGRCSGMGGERFVENLKMGVEKQAALGPIESAEISKFGEDPKDGDNRVFVMKCPYKVRSF